MSQNQGYIPAKSAAEVKKEELLRVENLLNPEKQILADLIQQMIGIRTQYEITKSRMNAIANSSSVYVHVDSNKFIEWILEETHHIDPSFQEPDHWSDSHCW